MSFCPVHGGVCHMGNFVSGENLMKIRQSRTLRDQDIKDKGTESPLSDYLTIISNHGLSKLDICAYKSLLNCRTPAIRIRSRNSGSCEINTSLVHYE